MTRHLADKWLRAAEKLAGLEPQQGTLWHGFRWGFATARKGLPDVDLASAGGWRSLAALKASYQRADANTMYAVVSGGAERGPVDLRAQLAHLSRTLGRVL